jgi:SAM-dependent methyltransferase
VTRARSIALPLMLLTGLCIFGVTAAQVPFVRTPERVVTAMLRVAKVSKDDVVYDLGCGDGRIVITAAKRFGARGVGIDNDPVRISEANANALASGVADRVRFIEQDLFEADLSEATVVTLYLVPSINLKLRSKLWRELKPGTRVVSHNYDMGDWAPKRKVGIGLHTVYYWVIPDELPSAST